jgi:hypothetical protein
MNNYKNKLEQIQNLALDINKNLSEDRNNIINKNKNDYMFIEKKTIPDTLIRPVILIITYYIFSQENIRLTFQRYIPILKPNDNNSFSQISILVYGSILTLTFYFIVNLLSV